MTETIWHDERGDNVVALANHPARIREDAHGELIRTTYRMKLAAEHVMTPDRLAELSEDARRVLEACERYGSCGD